LIEEMRPLTILDVSAEQHESAVALLRKFSDQKLTLVDAVGLRVMTDRGIKSCWSTDFHMGLTGVPLVIHSSD
jgi:predicted nucleic acid-binding protein